MKRSFRQITTLGLALLIAAGGPTLSADALPGGVTTAFCAKATVLGSTNQTALQTRVAGMRSDFSSRLSKMASDHSTLDNKVKAVREEANQKFEERIGKLQSNPDYSSEAKQKAIMTFKTAVEEAEATRAGAVDQARQTYRSSISDSLSAQQTALQQSVDVYQSAVKQAFANAVTNCASDSAAATLKTDLKAAREKLRDNRNANQVVADIKAMAENRRQAITTANKAFQASVKEAATTLKETLSTSEQKTTE